MLTYETYIKDNADPANESQFNQVERVVKRRINYLTFNRFNYENIELILIYNNILKTVLYELSGSGLFKDCYDQKEDELIIKSETVGEHKVDYEVVGSKLTDDERYSKIIQTTDRIIREYLGHTGLMYRGYYAY